ncbi:Os03g0643611 [Oryza sativa Japonica Group]|uniref:Os03g0643611 protein n=1 Tax=Oryza sativa subsp. japonica TaxID=39947 RepID=A0A0P0W199_ORYSJ|nr:hypothetical protein EE612_019206 [Oryza sativa]BAS85453.1 Os03g0643611 [Oryza sativa Japonica Group]
MRQWPSPAAQRATRRLPGAADGAGACPGHASVAATRPRKKGSADLAALLLRRRQASAPNPQVSLSFSPADIHLRLPPRSFTLQFAASTGYV